MSNQKLLKNCLNSESVWFFALFWVITLLLCIITPWSPLKLLGGHDMPHHLLTLMARPDSALTIYSPQWLGGTLLYPLYGILPLEQIGIFLHLNPVDAINLIIIFTMAAAGFWGVKCIEKLYEYYYEKQTLVTKNFFLWLLLALIFSFSPLFCWRITFGHMNMIISSMLTLIASNLFLSIRLARPFKPFEKILFVISCWHILSTVSQQLLIYTLYFIPLFALILFYKVPPRYYWQNFKKIIFEYILLISLPIILAIPDIWALVLFHSSGESSRGLQTGNIIFSYTKGSWLDVLGIFFWSKLYFLDKINYYFMHEINYPVGPFILLFVLFFFNSLKNRKMLFLESFTIFALIFWVIFSFDFQWLTDLTLFLFPPLKYFRVPGRMYILFVFVLLMFITTKIVFLQDQFKRGKYFWIINTIMMALACALAYYNTLYFDIFCFIFAAYFFIQQVLKLPGFFSPLTVLLMMLLGTLTSFSERAEEFASKETIAEFSKNIDIPFLKNPLERARVFLSYPFFGLNTPFALNISSLQGYSHPLMGFNTLSSSLEGIPFDTARLQFPTLLYSNNHALKILYNVHTDIFVQNNAVSARRFSDESQPLWFPVHPIPISSVHELPVVFSQNDANLGSYIHDNLLLFRDDYAHTYQNTDLSSCKSILAKNVSYTDGTFAINLQNPATVSCPMTVATNFSSFLVAQSTDQSGKIQDLKTHPSYGALLTVIVPPKIEAIKISAEIKYYSLIRFLSLFLAVIIAGGMVYGTTFRSKTGKKM
ncbi:MAG: hypothetical protein A2X86_12155 [Bdellovibrionales bacterium GWA2_49_15]|nr:MAG: hypothetical protein A2X86_12155 [Bdellovibrionales bacterium GWA2_49_15]